MQGLIHWGPQFTTPTDEVINAADISILTISISVIRFGALYNVSHSFPSQSVKPQICIIQSPI